MAAREIAFGTSGLRGPAEGFTRARIAAYTRAFVETCCPGLPGGQVLVGQDLRASSPAIAEAVAQALIGAGRLPVNAGTVPTPALAAYALARSLPAIMVTGSHTAADQNGLKFYRSEGELLKADEAPIRKAANARLTSQQTPPDLAEGPALPSVTGAVEAEYRDRYLNAFSSDILAGFTIGVLQHSAVGRDLVPEILTRLGARSIAFRRAETFTAVDTEAVEPEFLQSAREMIASHRLDAVVSTDGDGDRPLLIDETGQQINGDVMGAVTAKFLGADTVVTPLTSSSAIERSGWFKTVGRTKIGSPYVVEALKTAGGRLAVGFEANGGFLLQTPVTLPTGPLAPLPTRDALLPLIACLASARRQSVPVSHIARTLPPRTMKAGRLRPVAPDLARAFLERIATAPDARAAIMPALAAPEAVDLTDGVRLVLADQTVVHFRQSGNAPEMRCYVETASATDTDALLGVLLAHAEIYLRTLDTP